MHRRCLPTILLSLLGLLVLGLMSALAQQATAKDYKVQDSVAFRQGDVLQPIKDLSEATVVMLYMGDDIGERLSPILQRTLKPGSRVVSHQFSLGDWKPDKSITVQGKDEVDYELHCGW